MDRIPLKAEEREVLGKKVRHIRKMGLIPGHVFGKGVETEHVAVDAKEFKKVYDMAGETGVIDLKIGAEKVRPVMVKNSDYHGSTGKLLHIDFYQVNLKQKVTVSVPVVIVEPEEGIESVKMGEAILLQNLNEIHVEALPTDLIDQIEVNVTPLKNVDDAITVSQLTYNREIITVLNEPEEVVVKLAPAVTEEMKALLEEQEAEVAAAQEAAEGEAAEGEVVEGAETEGAEGVGSEEGAEGEKAEAAATENTEGEKQENG